MRMWRQQIKTRSMDFRLTHSPRATNALVQRYPEGEMHIVQQGNEKVDRIETP